MQKGPYDIEIFLIVVTALIITMVIFIVSIVYLYRKKQQLFGKSLQSLALLHEKEMLDTRLEIQEQTFQHISREIHDNINLSLTLAKLNLNTISCSLGTQAEVKIQNSIELITKSIIELSDISKALNSDLISQQGLVQAISEEIRRIEQSGSFIINYKVEGEPIYLNSQKELIIFRIIQEAFNNIIKHANASQCLLSLNFEKESLIVCIRDNGIGFADSDTISKTNAGMRNMNIRAKMLGGTMTVNSHKGNGTGLLFNLPYQNDVRTK
jgi:signal transduction histidine kinase